jgi:hypothetical protein
MHNSYCVNQVNKYYDLVTGFYEYGWGDSFHFAGRSATYTYQLKLLLYIDNNFFPRTRPSMCISLISDLLTITASVVSQLRCRVD